MVDKLTVSSEGDSPCTDECSSVSANETIFSFLPFPLGVDDKRLAAFLAVGVVGSLRVVSECSITVREISSSSFSAGMVSLACGGARLGVGVRIPDLCVRVGANGVCGTTSGGSSELKLVACFRGYVLLPGLDL